MKKLVLGMAIIGAFIAAGVAGADVRVLDMRGIVRVAPAGTQTYTAVNPGMILPVGVEISTGDGGYVKIEVSPGNIVSLRGNSRLVVREAQPKATRFQLLAGRIKGVFSRMVGGEKFDLQFGDTSVVASVKGTVLIAEHGNGLSSLQTLLGAVELVSRGHVVVVPQGHGASFDSDKGNYKIMILTDQQIKDGLGKGNDDGKNALLSFVVNTQALQAQNKEIITQVREEDFAVGRTVKDIHGNIARVEQRLFRPQANEIQFVNLVKRDSYTYKGKFGYNGSNGARLDYVATSVAFNMDLPDSVNAWPEFFSANKDDIKGLSAHFEMANVRNGQVGDKLQRTFDLRENADNPNGFDLNGTWYVVDDNAADKGEHGENGELWGTQVLTAYTRLDFAAIDQDHDGEINEVERELAISYQGQRVFLQMEGYALGEDGKVLNLNNILNGNEDPFAFAKTLSAEGIFSAVRNDGSSLMKEGNIDLVFIPDMVVAAVTRYLPSILAGNAAK